MKVTFYGKLADLLGRELDVEVERPCTIGTLRKQLVAEHPGAAGSLDDRRVRACVENVLVSDDHRLTSGDAVEFLAPVSGG